MKPLASAPVTQQPRFIILPPLGASVPPRFEDVEVDDYRYHDWLAAMQRFRGSLYLYDGALLSTQLTGDGRHILPSDEESWHVLTVTQQGSLCGCLKFHEEGPSRRYEELGIWRSAVAQSPVWREALRKTVEIDRFIAQEQRLRFGEVGGWAIAVDHRNSRESIRIVLGTFGLLKLLGGSIGLATATCKHGSASMLHRLGLSSLTVDGVDLPSYYDPYYRSEMELLRFDSRQPSPKYVSWVAELGAHLASSPVICGGRRVGYPTIPGDRGTVTYWLPTSTVAEAPSST
jgi:hypothetical protein